MSHRPHTRDSITVLSPNIKSGCTCASCHCRQPGTRITNQDLYKSHLYLNDQSSFETTHKSNFSGTPVQAQAREKTDTFDSHITFGDDHTDYSTTISEFHSQPGTIDQLPSISGRTHLNSATIFPNSGDKEFRTEHREAFIEHNLPFSAKLNDKEVNSKSGREVLQNHFKIGTSNEEKNFTTTVSTTFTPPVFQQRPKTSEYARRSTAGEAIRSQIMDDQPSFTTTTAENFISHPIIATRFRGDPAQDKHFSLGRYINYYQFKHEVGEEPMERLSETREAYTRHAPSSRSKKAENAFESHVFRYICKHFSHFPQGQRFGFRFHNNSIGHFPGSFWFCSDSSSIFKTT